MRVDHIELGLSARRERSQAIARLIATVFAWLVKPRYKSHAARPHFAR